MTENALALINDRNVADIFVPNGLEPVIEAIRTEVMTLAVDISTENGRKEIASVAHKIAKSKTTLDKLGKDYVAGIKAQSKTIDAERARAWNAIEKIQHEFRAPLTAYEEKEKARIAEREAVLAQMTSLPASGTSEEIERQISKLVELGKSLDWNEFSERAKQVHDVTYNALMEAFDAAKRQEIERVELERLRHAEQARLQKEREDRLQAEAAAKAKAEAEAAAERASDAARVKAKEEIERSERERLALEKAVADAKAAEAKALRDAEAAVQRERERIEEVQKAEAEAVAKREADKEHKAKINNDALFALISVIQENGLMNEDDINVIAKVIVVALASGKIPHVKINY